MRTFSRQAVKVLGYAVCPFLTAVPLLYTGMAYNYTVILNDPDTRLLFLLCNAPVAVYLVWMLWHVCPLVSRKQWYLENMILYLDSLAVLILPYKGNGSDVLSNMHVLLAYADFVICTVLLLQISFHSPELRTICICGILTVLLLAAAAGKVSGISELVYAFLLLFIVASAYLQKEKKENP
ncbi:MAG: hypothetical protein VZT48_10640 [Bulleidia sp.]|nr:hypothetical protein [Bulleidia sp.]